MSSEVLKHSLAREAQAKTQILEAAKLELMNAAEISRKELDKSVQSFRNDIQAVVQKTVVDLASEAKKNRQAFEAEFQKNKDALTRERIKNADLQRKLLIWGPAALLGVVVITVVLSVGMTWWSVNKGTVQALALLEQTTAAKIAESKVELISLQGQVAQAKQILDKYQAQGSRYQLMDRITVFQDPDGMLWAEVQDITKTDMISRRSQKPIMQLVVKPSTP